LGIKVKIDSCYWLNKQNKQNKQAGYDISELVTLLKNILKPVKIYSSLRENKNYEAG
jgi:hypothetical protein